MVFSVALCRARGPHTHQHHRVSGGLCALHTSASTQIPGFDFGKTPNAIWASAGAAEGDTELNAFDNALLAAQVGNLNRLPGSDGLNRRNVWARAK